MYWSNLAELKLDNAEANNEITQLRKESSEADEVMMKLTNVIENYSRNKFKKERKEKTVGGRPEWNEFSAQLVCELLILGVAPRAIPGTIVAHYELITGTPPKCAPSIKFIRECRDVLRVVIETLTAIELGNNPDWKQVFTNGTSRRQKPFTALLIGIAKDGGRIDPIIISSCIMASDETAETTFEACCEKVSPLRSIFCNLLTLTVVLCKSHLPILCQILSLKHRLRDMRDAIQARWPGQLELLANLPHEDAIDLKKLEKSWFTTDNCSTARKEQRLAIERLKCRGQNCWHHQGCTWLNATEKAADKYLTPILKTHLDECDSTLRVKMFFWHFVARTTRAFLSAQIILKDLARHILYTCASITRRIPSSMLLVVVVRVFMQYSRRLFHYI